ncbi:legumain [Procambarus clarkii]|uniref:legumain n=1 Tax=Procambarus clarkii TaxID=6728 RepID=UPI001E670855|nr:legumain-like [Procambarus clarkii]
MRVLLVLAVLLTVVTAAVFESERLRRALTEDDNDDEGTRGEIWAVLLAGSNGWWNYRHQADVCHAYQILHQHGVPDDRIIVMMYDDIAHNVENPNQGVVINRPSGPNVYEGVPRDYTGRDVTPENFLKVLQGDAEGLKGVGSGKVLKSGPNDRVFINMVDHGAPGIFAFPHGYLNATSLVDALLAMHQANRYWQMVMYVESCESGSLFQSLLPDDIEVYALSASAPDQHSYACYEDDTLHTFLGDVFSVKWMEDTDVENLHQETLKKQFLLVRKEVVTSTVMHWGELKLAAQKMSKFLGKKDPHRIFNHIANYDYEAFSPPVSSKFNDACLNTSVPSYDVPLAILKSRIKSAATPDEEQHWKEELTALRLNRGLVRFVMERLVREVTGVQATANMITSREHYHGISRRSCYEDSVRTFHDHCFDLAENPFALRVVNSIVNLCEHGYTHEAFLEATRVVCTHQTYTGIV